VFAVINTVDGHAYQLGGGIAATLIAFATASGLGGIAVCLATARPWTRIPTALTQLFVIIVGITLLQGHRLEWGVPALALAATCLAGLLTPASRHAGRRWYGPTEIRRLAIIQYWQRYGLMSLDEIGDILAGPAAGRRWGQLVRDRIDSLGAQIERMEATREYLEHVLSHHPDSAPDGCGHFEAMLFGAAAPEAGR